MPDINPPEVLKAGHQLAALMAAYRRSEDLITIGAYSEGANPTLDRAVRLIDKINAFLIQPMDEGVDLKASREQLLKLVEEDQ
jgi:flagellum-specific ATP synthase